MEVISFRCSSCNQGMKVGADKAGKKSKCPKCGTVVVIPRANSDAAAKPAVPKPPLPDDEEDDGGTYGLASEPGTAEVEEPRSKKKTRDEEKKDKPIRRKIKKKTVQFADDWRKTNVALIFAFAGMCVWGVCWVVRGVVFLLGFFATPHYSVLAEQAGQSGTMDVGTLSLGLLVGDNLVVGRILLIVEQVLALVAGGAFLGSYFVCLGVPDSHGTRGQAFTLVGLGILNLILVLIVRLLPLTGVMPYIMLPLVTPEIVMSEVNIERLLPLHVFWSGAPFWEVLAAIVIQITYFAEPILFCVFLRAVAMSVKDDEWLEPRALALLRLGFGQFFILLAYYLFSITGTSSVLRLILIVIYFLWRAFLLGFIIQFATTMWNGRARIAYLLEEEEED